MDKLSYPKNQQRKLRILFLSKTKDEEKLGGPYKWNKEIVSELKKKEEIVNFRSNWRYLFNGKIFRGFSKIKKADIIHIYVSNLSILFLVLYAKLKKKKIIYTCRGNFFEEWKGKSLWLFIKYYLIAKLADYFTFNSEYLQKIVIKRIPKESEIILGPHNSEECKTNGKLGNSNKKYTFLSVTSFDYYKKAKGVLLLSKAFNKFRNTYPKSELKIIGAGQFFKEIKERSKGENIIFLGKKKKKEVYEAMKTCDCFIHITCLDILPNTILEAASFKRPIIASKVGAIPTISKKIHLVNNNIEEIVEQMLYVYEKKEKAVEYPELSRFSTQKMTEKFIKLYRKLIHSPTPPY